ncbi:MAG: hypothetical protein U0792_01160 [Gemmataceae bacterium]
MSLEDVDPKRIGMTGASGGGTQTFMTAALDDRIAVAFPAVMVSTTMQGGCVCENCSLLRVNTGNVEIAGLFAPKPQAFSCAKDWTSEFNTKGLPELEQLYSLYGARDKVAAKAWLEYGHQYNVHARQFMYSWFLKHLQGKDQEVKEPAFMPVPPKELSVYDAEHPRPKDELNAEKLREVMTKASDEQIAKLKPKDAASLKEFQRVVGTALRAMVDSEKEPELFEVTSFRAPPGKSGSGDAGIFTRISDTQDRVHPLKLNRPALVEKDDGVKYTSGEAIPFRFIHRFNQKDWKGSVLWLHPAGTKSLLDKGKVAPLVQQLWEAGYSVLAIDTLWTGEQVGAKPFAVDKGFAGYTYGYNRSLLAQRVSDALFGLCIARRFIGTNKPLTHHLVGWGEMGPVAILAKALAGDTVKKTAADLNGFNFENIKDANDPMTLPGALKYGGMGAFLGLCAPGEVLVHNHKGTGSGDLSRAAYEAAGAADKLTRSAEKLDDAKVVEWLVK